MLSNSKKYLFVEIRHFYKRGVNRSTIVRARKSPQNKYPKLSLPQIYLCHQTTREKEAVEQIRPIQARVRDNEVKAASHSIKLVQAKCSRQHGVVVRNVVFTTMIAR